MTNCMTVRLPDDAYYKLKALSEESGRTMNKEIVRLIRNKKVKRGEKEEDVETVLNYMGEKHTLKKPMIAQYPAEKDDEQTRSD